MIKQYLIYDVGYGEQGSEVRYTYYRYYICEGKTEMEAVSDWVKQSPFCFSDVEKVNGRYLICGGRSWLEVIPLLDYCNNDEEQKLAWL